MSQPHCIEFSKYHGLGNDFIIINNFQDNSLIISPDQAKKLCNRNFGIGADGVILVCHPSNLSIFDYRMHIYNSDGSVAQMCGNGIRCMAKYIANEIEMKSVFIEPTTYRIETMAGLIETRITHDGSICVDMGKPILEANLVPTFLSPTIGDMAVQAQLKVHDLTCQVTCVSMGNPHTCIRVDNIDLMTPAFIQLGPVVECHEAFPEKVNVGFYQVHNRTHISLKVWERGVGPTLACGTGACAALVSCVLTNATERSCKVSLPGGNLHIEWRQSDGRVQMTGPAVKIFCGQFDLSICNWESECET